MNIVATSLIILLGLSYGFARRTPGYFTELMRSYKPIPLSSEVWREPFFVSDSDEVGDASSLLPKPPLESDSQESHETDTGRKIGGNDADNSNGDSEEEHEYDLKQQNNLDKDDNDSSEDKDEEEENLKVDDEEEDQNEDGENMSISEEKDKDSQDEEDDDDMPDEIKKGLVNPAVPPFFGGSLSLNNHFFNLKQMTDYLKQLEGALEQVLRQTREEAALLNGTYANTTEENVDINGQKFLVQKSVIKTGDNNSSIFIETVDVLPEQSTNKTKRSNWYAEKAQKAKESDP